MAHIELVMPKMGESIIEATILNWLKAPGDRVEMDETILEIATDKVDSEIPSPVDGVIEQILFKENDVVEIGSVIAIINTEEGAAEVQEIEEQIAELTANVPAAQSQSSDSNLASQSGAKIPTTSNGRFYSPLVRSIATTEGVTVSELDQISGSGMNGRVTKKDILAYIDSSAGSAQKAASFSSPSAKPAISPTRSAASSHTTAVEIPPAVAGSGEEIIEMDRMRKLIAKHMVNSVHTSPHVTSMVEADVTNMVHWRNRVKNEFQAKHGEKLTYTPLLMEAVIKAIKDFPMINISLHGEQIIKKNYINLGMATALPNGNLIVPVIKNADHKNLVGLTSSVNDLARRARENKLKPEDIQDGTYTVTNVGTFGNVMGTPIINQPQVAILAMGAIRKRPAVLETEHGDVIAIRHMMFMSHSYDHRVVDGYLGGSFVKRVADYLEQFDINREI